MPLEPARCLNTTFGLTQWLWILQRVTTASWALRLQEKKDCKFQAFSTLGAFLNFWRLLFSCCPLCLSALNCARALAACELSHINQVARCVYCQNSMCCKIRQGHWVHQPVAAGIESLWINKAFVLELATPILLLFSGMSSSRRSLQCSVIFSTLMEPQSRF